MNQVIALTRPFVALCFLKLGPQDLPASFVLLWVTLLAHTLTESLGAAIIMPDHNPLLAGLSASTVLVILISAMLALQNRRARVVQTITALAGAITLIDVLGIPLASWLQHAESTGMDQGIPALALLALTIWNWVIHGHVFRHALSIPFGVALLVSAFFFWISFQIMHYLFPSTLA